MNTTTCTHTSIKDDTYIGTSFLTNCCAAKVSRDYWDGDEQYRSFCTCCTIEVGYGEHPASYYGIKILQVEEATK